MSNEIIVTEEGRVTLVVESEPASEIVIAERPYLLVLPPTEQSELVTVYQGTPGSPGPAGPPGVQGPPGPPGSDATSPPESDANLSTDYGNTAAGGGSYNTIVGAQASTTGGAGATILGCRAATGGIYAGALGYGAYGGGSESLALGHNAIANAAGSVAIGTDDTGAGANVSVANQIKLGTTKHTVACANVTVSNVLNSGIVRVPGIDLWNDGHMYFASQAVSVWGDSASVRTNKDFRAGGAVYANNVQLNPWMQMTQAAYDALGTKDPNTLYVIVG